MNVLRSLAAGALVAVGCLAVPSAAPAAAIGLAMRPPLSQVDVAGSVGYLTRTYGVSPAEAMRRLELQRTAASLQDVLARDYPDTYAGAWIDQEHGGLLMIGSTRPATLTTTLGAIADREHIRVVLSNRLATATATVVPNGGVRVPKACILQNCTPPMRGGLKLYIFDALSSRPDWIWFCTSGFNVHGSDGRQYLVTAGHCFAGAGNYAGNNGHWAGYYQAPTLAGFFDDYPADGMIAPYVVTGGVDYAGYWLGNQPTNGVWDTNRGSLLPITGTYDYAQIGVGWIVCSTGARSLNTRCGSVVDKDGGLVTDICTRGGDSGGPLFSELDNRAYGVPSWGNNPDDNCPPGVRSGFSPLSVLFSTVQAKSGISFAVNTT